MPTGLERAYFHNYYLKHDGANRKRIVPGVEREAKICKRCNVLKVRSEFTIRESGRIGHLSTYCKECNVEAHKNRIKRDPSIYRRSEWPSKLKRLYGITVDDYHRMLKEQNYGCALCGSTDPSMGNRGYIRNGNKTIRSVFDVDHNHKTGKVRGLLCTKCNRLVGLANDSLTTAQNLVQYLSKEV